MVTKKTNVSAPFRTKLERLFDFPISLGEPPKAKQMAAAIEDLPVRQRNVKSGGRTSLGGCTCAIRSYDHVDVGSWIHFSIRVGQEVLEKRERREVQHEPETNTKRVSMETSRTQ